MILKSPVRTCGIFMKNGREALARGENLSLCVFRQGDVARTPAAQNDAPKR